MTAECSRTPEGRRARTSNKAKPGNGDRDQNLSGVPSAGKSGQPLPKVVPLQASHHVRICSESGSPRTPLCSLATLRNALQRMLLRCDNMLVMIIAGVSLIVVMKWYRCSSSGLSLLQDCDSSHYLFRTLLHPKDMVSYVGPSGPNRKGCCNQAAMAPAHPSEWQGMSCCKRL